MQRSNLILLTVIAGLLFSLPYFRVAAPVPAPAEEAIDPQTLSPSSLELAVREYDQTGQPKFASSVSKSLKPEITPKYRAPRPLTYADVALPIPPDPVQRRKFSALHVTESQRDGNSEAASPVAPQHVVAPAGSRLETSLQADTAFDQLDRMFAEKEFVAQPQTPTIDHSQAIAGASAIRSVPATSTSRSPDAPGNFASTRQMRPDRGGEILPLSDSAQVTIGPMNVRLPSNQDSNQDHQLAPPLNGSEASNSSVALPALPDNSVTSSSVASQPKQRPRQAIYQPD